MNLLATNPTDAFSTVIWTLIIPAMFVASLVAFLIPVFSKKLERSVTRMCRQSRSPEQKLKNSTRQPTIPLCAIDGATPNCPTCNRVMVLRKNRRGARQGSSFWGCPAYPDCRGTRDIEIS